MKTTYTVATIVMFAMILGMGVLAPAMASKPDADGKHKSVLCHYQGPETILNDDGTTTEIPDAYVVIEVDNKGKMNGHFKNGEAHHFPVDENGDATGDQGDFEITNDAEVDETEENDSVADCLELDAELQNTDTVVIEA